VADTEATLVMPTLVGETPRLDAVALMKAARTDGSAKVVSETPASATPA
jgi:hypothetical protein